MSASAKQTVDEQQIQTLPLEPAPKKKGARKLVSMASTFLTVAVLTCLLWIWANQAQQLRESVRVVVTVATAADSRLILMGLDDGSGQPVAQASGGVREVETEVLFKATRSRLRELQRDLKSGELELFVYLSERVYLTGEQKINVADELNTMDELIDRGVMVESVEPAEIVAILDEWEWLKDVRLELKKTTEAVTFEHYIDPPQMAVEVPASLLDDLKINPQALMVELTRIPEKITPNLEVSATVASKLGNHTVRPELSAVKVILNPKEQDREKSGPLQIYASVPPDMIGSHVVEWEEEASRMVEVELIGPRAELNKIKAAGEENIMAFIVLGSTHAEETETFYTVPVQFRFGEGIHDVKLDGPGKTVKVRLRKIGEE